MSQVVVKRFFGKKRGSRNMRSDKLGGASLGLFFAVFFLFGCASLALILRDRTIPDWRANFAFYPTTCTVVDKRIDQYPEGTAVRCRPEFLIEYTVAGTQYKVWTYDVARPYTSDEAFCQQAIEQFDVGKQYPCWYDPHEPEHAVLIRGHNWFAWLPLVLPASFLAIGAGGLVYTLLNWNKSTERRTVWARTAARLDPLESISGANQLFPTVPGHTRLIDSPGTKLRYRLPLSGPSWTLFGLLGASLVWNAVVIFLLGVAIRRHLQDRADWAFTTLMVLFLGIGIAWIVLTVRRFVVAADVGSTILEIDHHPLYPGGRYRLFLSQAGRRNLKQLRVVLACDEEARYLQGTNLRTARQRVQEVVLLDVANVSIQRGEPYESHFTVEVPAAAMHSFYSDHNRVVWKLLVQGKPSEGADFERVYSLSVYPLEVPRMIAGRQVARSGSA